VNVGGYKVAYRSAAGTSDTTLATIPDGTTIPAGGFYLLAGSGYLGSHAPDQTFSASLAATGGGLAVRDATRSDPRLRRLRGATNAFVEGHRGRRAARHGGTGSSADRIPDGHDTNDNAADFSVSAAPSPGRRTTSATGGRPATRPPANHSNGACPAPKGHR
jgi:hypothetical protein